ncbi:DUF1015 domain-containing protein [Collinsella intestinalis]|uniref:DUF1015 domain-containing protein n=1 Tax=Collinsella intestinalis TaxID=147207 RepID=UPI0025A339C4|nr:DUF1015 domain-containing protein [Collinsella intestinalis]MDM8163058.1 DUF1015 domain-containing protein [Collinsella intestinalis]
MKVLPFPCIRPVPERAAEVAALPYDVFDRAEAAAYVANHPLSFLAIDRPETQFAPDADMYAPEVYARGAELLHERIDEGIYQTDPSMSYYLYELTQNGRTQTGVVAICSVDEYDNGIIKKHENTRAAKERDRIEHIRALGCQTGPIFLTYRDEPVLSFILAQVKTGQALYDFTDEEGVHQRVWEVRRPESVEALREMFARVPCAYIADGHHRTASAMRVAHEMRAAAQEAGTYTGKEPFNYFLSVLFPASELTILPYNRVVSDRAGLSVDELIARIHEAGFTVEPSSEPVESAEVGVMGLFTAGSWYRLSFTPELASAVAQAGAVESLDVSVLQDRVLGPILGIGDPREDARISFVGGIRGTAELERRAGADGVAFSMCATTIDQLLAVADAGLLMPPKSTWFEPKLRSGLFIHRIAR